MKLRWKGVHMLAISHTAHPCGTIVKYKYGMPMPKVKNMGAIMKQAVMNTVRKGGACFEDEMDKLIDQAHEILTTNSKSRK